MIGLLLAFGLILVVDMPKLRVAEGQNKYLAVYGIIFAASLLLSVLEVFQLIPDYNAAIIDFYKKLSGQS